MIVDVECVKETRVVFQPTTQVATCTSSGIDDDGLVDAGGEGMRTVWPYELVEYDAETQGLVPVHCSFMLLELLPPPLTGLEGLPLSPLLVLLFLLTNEKRRRFGVPCVSAMASLVVKQMISDLTCEGAVPWYCDK